ncbi:MAG: squalene--hopene cyclase [Myxococcales bacterium]|nr:squalene--hopene cyclase [Myxococcales bacterium]
MSPDRNDTPTATAAARALERASARLLALQDPSGWWKGELQTNVTMDAEDMLMREFLGIRRDATTAQSAAWIRSQQLPSGAWNIYYGGPRNLSATVEAYVALRLAGDPAEAEHMKGAAEQIRAMGGVERTRVFTRIWLSMVGLWSWDDIPALPPELIFLPSWCPLNIYDFGCWARQTIVPLTIVAAHRPVRALSFDVDELRAGAPPRTRESLRTWRGRFQLLDRILHRYERRPWQRLRQHAMRVAAEWIVRRQEADGCWGGIQPPWVYSMMALHLLGYPLDHPVLKQGLEGLEGFTIVEGDTRRFEACQSPVWDTALAMVALRDAGFASDHPALLRAARYMLDEEVRVQGDWAVKRPHLEPGGWAFEFQNDNYADIDDTAEVVLALDGLAHPDPAELEGAIERALHWVWGMQCRDGGWGAFDVDNTRQLTRELPFCDFGEVIDPPSADVTAHIIEMMARRGRGDDPRLARAIEWLLREQEPSGSWFGRWGANHLYGTGAAVPALVEAGVPRAHPAIRRAVRWLESCQNDDGGWGEDLRSYDDPQWHGLGDSTASQTAWALLALLAAGERSRAVDRGAAWLARTQREDGNWNEPQFTGTGFPRDFYINYHLYRIVFPVMALGRYLEKRA